MQLLIYNSVSILNLSLLDHMRLCSHTTNFAISFFKYNLLILNWQLPIFLHLNVPPITAFNFSFYNQILFQISKSNVITWIYNQSKVDFTSLSFYFFDHNYIISSIPFLTLNLPIYPSLLIFKLMTFSLTIYAYVYLSIVHIHIYVYMLCIYIHI